MKLKEMKGPFRARKFSDVPRDGAGLELLSGDAVVAEIFRRDADHALTITTFAHDLPLTAVEQFIVRARRELEEFEDGTPLPVSEKGEVG